MGLLCHIRQVVQTRLAVRQWFFAGGSPCPGEAVTDICAVEPCTNIVVWCSGLSRAGIGLKDPYESLSMMTFCDILWWHLCFPYITQSQQHRLWWDVFGDALCDAVGITALSNRQMVDPDWNRRVQNCSLLLKHPCDSRFTSAERLAHTFQG